MQATNGVTEEYYYSLLINLYLQNSGDVELTDNQMEHLIKLKMQLDNVDDYDIAAFNVGMDVNNLPDREELRRELNAS